MDMSNREDELLELLQLVDAAGLLDKSNVNNEHDEAVWSNNIAKALGLESNDPQVTSRVSDETQEIDKQPVIMDMYTSTWEEDLSEALEDIDSGNFPGAVGFDLSRAPGDQDLLAASIYEVSHLAETDLPRSSPRNMAQHACGQDRFQSVSHRGGSPQAHQQDHLQFVPPRSELSGAQDQYRFQHPPSRSEGPRARGEGQFQPPHGDLLTFQHNGNMAMEGQPEDLHMERPVFSSQVDQRTLKRRRPLDQPVTPSKRFRSTVDAGIVPQQISTQSGRVQAGEPRRDSVRDFAFQQYGSEPGEQEDAINADSPPTAPIKQPRAWKLRHHVSDTVNLPDGIEFTMMELSRFFPKCFSRPNLMDRAIRNGFDPITLAEMEMSAFADYSWKDIKDSTERYKQHKQAGLKLLYGNSKSATAIAQGPQHDMTASKLDLKSSYNQGKLRVRKENLLLRDIHDSVDIFPTGNDRGVWTACLQYWKATEAFHPNATTADVPGFMEILGNAGLLPTLTTNGHANHDMETLARFGRRSQANASKPKPA